MPEYLRIPKDRIGALIGHQGKTKAMLEKKCGIQLNVTQDGGASITSPEEDGLKEWTALSVVKAIARGFNPKYALLLLKDDYTLSIIDLYDLMNQKESAVTRIKARVIGEHGKARQTIETLTNTHLSVYGKTLSIIGYESDVALTEKAVQMLIDGARHASVYGFLEREKSQARKGV